MQLKQTRERIQRERARERELEIIITHNRANIIPIINNIIIEKKKKKKKYSHVDNHNVIRFSLSYVIIIIVINK